MPHDWHPIEAPEGDVTDGARAMFCRVLPDGKVELRQGQDGPVQTMTWEEFNEWRGGWRG